MVGSGDDWKKREMAQLAGVDVVMAEADREFVKKRRSIHKNISCNKLRSI